jgi:signal transduction histidine kinase
MRVATNLVANARQAMNDHGQLSVRTENVHVENPTAGQLQVPRGEYARLSIADTGHGIPEEHRSRIFDPFFTTKKKSLSHGSGLGLSAVHAVVEDHGGYLDFESTVGVGTTFHVYLPTARKNTPAVRAQGSDNAQLGPRLEDRVEPPAAAGKADSPGR